MVTTVSITELGYTCERESILEVKGLSYNKVLLQASSWVCVYHICPGRPASLDPLLSYALKIDCYNIGFTRIKYERNLKNAFSIAIIALPRI